jgi:TolB protein
MKKFATFLLLALGAAAPAFAQLRLTITQGVTDPIPIAIVPFANAAPISSDVAEIIQADLESTGRFKGMPRADMITKPSAAAEVDSAAWKQMRNDFVVVGRVRALPSGDIEVKGELVNVLTGLSLGGRTVTVAPGKLRFAAHRIADAVHEKILGVLGAFSTRIAYVSVDGRPPKQSYQLVVADSDGFNSKIVLRSALPIMSPSWSPDGVMLAYVSFEFKTSSVFVHNVFTAQRSRVSARAGINGAPSWSPDGKKLALTLSGSNGNLDIYLLDLTSQKHTRITDDPAIDTEAVFTADGGALYFTSDRAGSPQVYRVGLNGAERPKRITFTGSYNARPRISPDGKKLAVLTLDNGAYRIGIQDIATGAMQIISKGVQDESPSFAPNGAMLILAGRERGQGVLQTVSADGLSSARLNADAGEVREPVWGPFLPENRTP